MKKIAVGSGVDAYCTKCKLVLNHTVVIIESGKPRRVRCDTCGSEHNYRATKPMPKTPVKKGERAKPSVRKTRQTWEEAMQQASARPRKQYSMSGSFGEGDWIEHRTFGIGCVQSFVPPNKIVVRFADSTRTLICNQS